MPIAQQMGSADVVEEEWQCQRVLSGTAGPMRFFVCFVLFVCQRLEPPYGGPEFASDCRSPTARLHQKHL